MSLKGKDTPDSLYVLFFNSSISKASLLIPIVSKCTSVHFVTFGDLLLTLVYVLSIPF